MSTYSDVYNQWKQDSQGFWTKAAQDIEWYTPPRKVLDDANPPFYRWFEGASCNTSYNCLDRQIADGRGDQPAIVYESPMTDSRQVFTYSELTQRVAKFAGAMAALGITTGDRVLIYMPMVPEAAVAMLACARLGAVHSVVFGGFAAKELATRIDDAAPKLILAASCGLEPGRVVDYMPLMRQAVQMASHKVTQTIILNREQCLATLQDGDHDWRAVEDAAAPHDPVPVAATDPLYVLYTSGTTGVPKGVVRDNGGHMVALKWSMQNVFGVNPGEAYWAASDVGWVVGHSYIVYGPLLHGCTSILFEGKPVGTPDAGTFWRVIERNKVTVFFTAPTAFRAIKRDDPEGTFVKKSDLSSLRALFLAGERADPDTIKWAETQLDVPVIDHWWQTELGYPAIANPLGIEQLPVKYGSPAVPMPGFDVQVLGEDGKPVPAGDIGAIVLKLPLPPGTLPTLWHNDDGYKSSYLEEYPGYYQTGDAGYVDEDGYVYVMARTDDIINVAGHRLSTGGMEEVLAEHKDVAECAVVGVADKLKGQIPLGFVCLKAGVNREEAELEGEFVALVRERIGPVAAFKTALVVDRLPKTRSGKILRGTVRKIIDGEDWTLPATIDDPAILDEITERLKERGII